jgi:hypothetical protein
MAAFKLILVSLAGWMNRQQQGAGGDQPYEHETRTIRVSGHYAMPKRYD